MVLKLNAVNSSVGGLRLIGGRGRVKTPVPLTHCLVVEILYNIVL